MQPKEQRIKELLRERGLDGAIVSSPENFHYVIGFGDISTSCPGSRVLPWQL